MRSTPVLFLMILLFTPGLYTGCGDTSTDTAATDAAAPDAQDDASDDTTGTTGTDDTEQETDAVPPSDVEESTDQESTDDTGIPTEDISPDISEVSDGCETADDCTVSEYEWMVTSEQQCFCPMCPTSVVTVSEHEARQAGWEEYCVDWANAMPCPDVDCEEPPDLKCVEGLCGVANPVPNSCDTIVDCDAPPPECTPGLIPVNKNGCWGCGNPTTCTCSDGTDITCEGKPPSCGENQELAVVEGCHACVDPITCHEVQALGECEGDEDCTFTEYKAILENGDLCYCPMCPVFPTSVADHEARKASWETYCAQWAVEASCPDPSCIDPGVATCEAGECTGDKPLPPTPCATDVSCDSDPPKCFLGMVLANKDGCWACVYPQTCSCSDGSDLTCPIDAPECGENEELAIIKGCHICVDPVMCKPVLGIPPDPDPEGCKDNAECIFTEFEFLVESEADCFCPMCPFWPVTQAEHEARVTAWIEQCTAWEATTPCPVPGCIDPGNAICDEGVCVAEDDEVTPFSCNIDVDCDAPPPECAEPLIPVNKEGCWGCAYADTCTCSDGQSVTCEVLGQPCPEGTEEAKQDGCYVCVDPITCLPKL